MNSFMTKICLCLALTAQTALADTLGDSLWRTYSKYVGLPTTTSDASSQGWYSTGQGCSSRLGEAWTQNSNGAPSTDKPIVLYFTPNGQVSGVGTMGYGNFSGAVVDQGYWQKVAEDEYFISVTFRDPDSVCDTDFTSDDILGDRALINANTMGRSIPLVQADAVTEGYETGSCFASMGTHSFYDIEGENGAMTWVADNLMPVVPMYDRNNDWKLNAIFFTTPFIQQSLFNSNEWEPVFLANYLMCKNWCDDSCGWSDTKAWSTSHIYFSDPKQVTCENGCSIGCCETD